MTVSAGSQRQLERGARARRHNHALVALGRRVWHEDCTFESAVAEICEVAAETLGVERVNVWRVDAAIHRLHCVHAYVRSTGTHNPAGFDESLPLDSEYGIQLDEVRVVDIADVAKDATVSASQEALGAYLRFHDVHSLLDAPIRAEGMLIGVVCHEHVGSARMWSPEDYAFAGSIGDYIAVAYEVARRREIENRLRFLERHDAQTNLPNRDHLLEVAHSALRPRHDNDAGLAVIHLQIDPPAGNENLDVEGFHRFLVDCAEHLRELTTDNAALARVREDAFDHPASPSARSRSAGTGRALHRPGADRRRRAHRLSGHGHRRHRVLARSRRAVRRRAAAQRRKRQPARASERT